MALDKMAIISLGVFPTLTPTSTLRAALAISMGLLNQELPGYVVPIISWVKRKWLTIYKMLRM